MQRLSFVAIFGAVSLLAGCNSTLDGLKSDWGNFTASAEKERQYVAQRMPQAYPTADRVVVKPPQPTVEAVSADTVFTPMTVDRPVPEIDSENLQWNDLGKYDANTYVQDTRMTPAVGMGDGMAPITLTKGNKGAAIMVPDLDMANPVVEPTVVRQQIPAGAKRYNDSITVFPLGDEFDLMFEPRYVAETALPMSVVSSDGVRLEGGLTTNYTDGGVLPSDVADMIFFRHGSSRLDGMDMKKIRDIADRAASGNFNIRVIGHASKTVYTVSDPDTKRLINMAMSEKRARAVGNALERAGVNADVTWVGDERSNQNVGHRTQEAADRRVEMVLEQK